MADKLRPPQETKEIGIKRLVECYEKTNQKQCPSSQVRKFEKLYENELLPKVYGDHK